MPLKAILVGTGGFGAVWCRKYLPINVADGTIEVVAVVDIDNRAFENAIEGLQIPRNRCYSDLAQATQEVSADCVFVVVPPNQHEPVIDVAIEQKLHVLCEKPIADTLDAALRIVDKIENAGLKMAVTMSHRFDQDKTTLRALLRDGGYGRLDYLVYRFTANYRERESWGNRHQMQDPLLIEGAVHHFDMLADLANANISSIYVQSWTPPWGDYDGDAQAIALIQFENGVRAIYEAAMCNAATMNGWKQDYVRCELEKATIELDSRQIYVRELDKTLSPLEPRADRHTKRIPLIEQAKWSNTWLVEKFARWCEHGERMATDVRSNLQSIANVFAAIESGQSKKTVDVQDFLRQAQVRHSSRTHQSDK